MGKLKKLLCHEIIDFLPNKTIRELNKVKIKMFYEYAKKRKREINLLKVRILTSYYLIEDIEKEKRIAKNKLDYINYKIQAKYDYVMKKFVENGSCSSLDFYIDMFDKLDL